MQGFHWFLWLNFWLLQLFKCTCQDQSDQETNDDDYYDDEKYDGYLDPITIGSMAKLLHVNSNYLLHSHEISYGSGSGQQSVTGYEHLGDSNSLWQIYPSSDNKTWKHGKCEYTAYYTHFFVQG